MDSNVFFFCIGIGGVIGLLALNALFVLMKEYNLYVFLSLHSISHAHVGKMNP